jgi:HD-like signal output (HDOD) protein
MELKTQKALFTLGVNAFGKIAEIIKETDYLPQKPLNHFKLLKLILEKDQITDFTNLITEINRDKNLLKNIVSVLSSKEKQNLISAESLQTVLRDFEKNFLENLIEASIAQSYTQCLQLSSSPKMHADWKLSLKSAVIAVSIARWAGMQDLEMAFMGALLSELPTMVIGIQEPQIIHFIEEKIANGMPKRNAEILALGFDHTELGAKLFKYYGMPADLIELIQAGYESNKVKSKNKMLCDVINFSKFIAKSFSDKSQSPSTMWNGSQIYIRELGLKINPEDWGNKISLLFVKSLEFEMSVMS